MKFVYFLSIILLLISCSKEGDGVATKSDSNYLQNNPFQNNTETNAFYYNFNMYMFAKARVLNNSYGDNNYNKNLLLYSKGFHFAEDGDLIDGKGSYVYVSLKTSSYSDGIQTGKYFYTSNSNSNEYTFNYSEFEINFDSNTSTDYAYDIIDGYFDVKKTGNNYYTVVFDCIDENGGRIYGRYSGIVIFD